METPKYYTPEIIEFHVGFEFEMHSTITQSFCRTATAEWTSIHLHETDFLIALLPAIHNKNVRVKHLDREDIESLEWECRLFNQSYNSGEFIINNKYILIFNLIDLFCVIKHINFPDRVEKNIISVFQGIIKNKSELKKIMKQLNIS